MRNLLQKKESAWSGIWGPKVPRGRRDGNELDEADDGKPQWLGLVGMLPRLMLEESPGSVHARNLHKYERTGLTISILPPT